MLKDSFGFGKKYEEEAILEAITEHNLIDEEELSLLVSMIEDCCLGKLDQVEESYDKMQQIHAESFIEFSSVAEMIIQADFNHQKQYDLLRLYQRVDGISETLLSSSTAIRIFVNKSSSFPL